MSSQLKVIFFVVCFLVFPAGKSFAQKPHVRVTDGGYEHFYCNGEDEVFWVDRCYYSKELKSKTWNGFDKLFHWYKKGDHRVDFDDDDRGKKKKIRLRFRGGDGGTLLLYYRHHFGQ